MNWAMCCLGKIRKKAGTATVKSDTILDALPTDTSEIQILDTIRPGPIEITYASQNVKGFQPYEADMQSNEFLPLYKEENGILKDTGEKLELFR